VELSDGTVVRRVLDGDIELFRVLVERYREQFGKYAVALVGDSDTAADAMQEAFIRAYRSLTSCRDPDRFGAWFHRILTNQCHDARAKQSTPGSLDRLDLPGNDRTDAPAEQTEIGDAISAALARLTPEQKEAFVMKHVDGRSYDEMAELTGVGVDALKMRVHRARDGLREMLGGVL